MHCPNGHENPAGSRFCLQCGEKLEPTVNQGIYPGLILGDRYRIIRQLGQGGFGRTYLAEDINRFNEACVLKEFAPQVQTSYVIQKAEELFEREAGVLYKLQHPQIPRFRELFRVNLDGKAYLFLVQDYVEGKTYHALLETRRLQGLRFNQAEIIQLLFQILPVLEYIHSMGVIHRDISPDNLILRNSDFLPILIDFGGVKQVAATVASQYNQATAAPPTLLGKVGYAPREQMQMGIVYPHSDLYALAVTVLVLLTGKEPQDLIDDNTLTWNWRREVNLSPNLGSVLDRMLSQRPGDRFQSASQVLQALNSNNTPTPQPLPVPDTQVTYAVAPANHPISANYPQPIPTYTSNPGIPPAKTATLFPWGIVILVSLSIIGIAGIGFWAANNWLQVSSDPPEDVTPPTVSPSATVSPTPSPQFSVEEQNRKQRLRDRREQLGINSNFYTNLVNQLFWEKYPNQRGRNLSSSPEDETLRAQWDQTAADVLNKLQSISAASRRQLGAYTAADRDRWKLEVNQVNVGSRSLYDLTDGVFFQLFPQQRSKDFINQPIGQVWYALANDKLNAILAKTAFETIVFDPDAFGKSVSGALQPGEGKVYIAGLTKEQILTVNLEADPKLLLSIYSPSGKVVLLEDASDRTYSGTLPEGGFYEFVVVSTASTPLDYTLNVTAENDTTPEPTVEPSPSASPTNSPEQENFF